MMKTLIISIFLLVLSSTVVMAQFVVNHGGQIIIQHNSNFIIDGNYVGESNGTISNMGNVGITGNWTNNTILATGTSENSGQYNFFGDGYQEVNGDERAVFSNVLLNNNLMLNTEVVLLSSLTFNNSKLKVDEKDLYLDDTIRFFGINNQSYVETAGSGEILKLVDDQASTFPVGDSSALFQLEISNAGQADTVGVRIIGGVLENGTVGGNISKMDHCVNNSWIISERNPGGANFSITASWPGNAENEFFDRTECGLGIYAGSWQPQNAGSAIGVDPYSVTRQNISELTALAIGDISSPMALELHLYLDVSVFFEGPFDGESMNTNMAPNYFPMNQPFNCEPWNYSGTEFLDSIPNPNVVDWILVDVRDTTNANLATSASTVYRCAGLLLANGRIVDIDGFSGLNCLIDSVKNDIFVALFHRNHLSVLSSQPLIKQNGIYSYNFSISNIHAYGTESQKQLTENIFGMYAGDIDGNGIVDFQDLQAWENEAAKPGYLNSDINLDGQSDNRDKNLFWYFNQFKESQIPDIE